MKHSCSVESGGAKEIAQRSRRDASTLAEAVSFEEFFVDTQRDLLGALWLVTRNRYEAEEVAQEAYVKIWERWNKVAGLDDSTGYLYRTAMNVWRGRLRRAEVAVRRVVHRMPQEDAIAQVEARDEVVRALAHATPRERAALVLMDLCGFTSKEAGAALGIRGSTVRVLAARARITIAEEVER